MGKEGSRFVGRAEAGKGWRIWDNKMRKFWGERYENYPALLLAELNGAKRPDRLKELVRQTPRKRS